MSREYRDLKKKVRKVRTFEQGTNTEAEENVVVTKQSNSDRRETAVNDDDVVKEVVVQKW